MPGRPKPTGRIAGGKSLNKFTLAAITIGVLIHVNTPVTWIERRGLARAMKHGGERLGLVRFLHYRLE
jgi:hypothetical protein